jgi:phage terminase large subunit-like protein
MATEERDFTEEEIDAQLALVEEKLAGRKLDLYKPHPKQELFHRMGGDVSISDRLLMAGNQLGKTLCAAAETSMHLTGEYPDWWSGKRFPTRVRGWVGSETNQATRDAAQMLLMGPPGEWGTGYIPARRIVDYSKATHGVPNALESVIVKHVSGKNSQLQFKSYDQGRQRWQGATLDFVWFDDEPPMDIFVEGRTRTNVPGNFTYMTFTPLLGMSEVVIRYLKEKPPGSVVIPMTIEDALHYSPEQRKKIVAGYPVHERKARAQGIPILGSGAVFPIEQEQIECMPFQIPEHWPRICGMDLGWEHPTACAWIAWDRDTDTIYIYDIHRVKEQTPIFHAATMKAKGVWIPVAWPHDGLQHDKGSGAVIAQQYRNLGVNMLKDKATHKPEKGKKEGTGGYGLEAGISEMLQRMQTGRFKVFSTCNDWFEEYRMYYRKDGLIVKEHDDLMSATRIGVMMLRFAKCKRPDTLNAPKLPVFEPSYSSTGVLG